VFLGRGHILFIFAKVLSMEYSSGPVILSKIPVYISTCGALKLLVAI